VNQFYLLKELFEKDPAAAGTEQEPSENLHAFIKLMAIINTIWLKDEQFREKWRLVTDERKNDNK
jgi:hypothetical protein